MPQNNDQCQCRIIHAEKVERAKKSLPDHRETSRLAGLFKALADPSRLKILMALAKEEMCVCDLAAFLDISESAVSHQLRLLRQLGLVENRREGPVLYYNLSDNRAAGLIAFAREHFCPKE